MSFIAKKIVLASSNLGKLAEFNALFGPLGIELISQQALGIAPAPEPFFTFVENALTKARQASSISGLPSLADDSGICVEALDGAPGIHSARFAGPDSTDTQNNEHLLDLMKNHTNKRARYVCALVFIRHTNDPEPIIASGTWNGEIIDSPRGANGFGYDPFFFLPDLGQTAAELPPALKNKISHRALAMQELMLKISHE
ncbi:MAG: RdgB/HAM1 family non-canonical purine NTP pyrophosphatase [Betaproteobacteria bacterium]